MKCENSTRIEQIRYLNASSRRGTFPRASAEDPLGLPSHDEFLVEQEVATPELLEHRVARHEQSQGQGAVTECSYHRGAGTPPSEDRRCRLFRHRFHPTGSRRRSHDKACGLKGHQYRSAPRNMIPCQVRLQTELRRSVWTVEKVSWPPRCILICSLRHSVRLRSSSPVLRRARSLIRSPFLIRRDRMDSRRIGCEEPV